MDLEFKNISKLYGGIHALKNASLLLSSGDVRALLGGNGSGKSTLIKVASGLVKPDEGEVLIDGGKVAIHSPKAAKRLRIVATSQELSILPNLTVGENITLCNMPTHNGIFTNRSVVRQETQSILEKLGLGGDIDTPVRDLPINKKYLIEFGKAIFQDFDILLIDEITSALYREDVEIVKAIIKQYKEQGKIILFVSHRMSEIFSICDTVTVMRNGEIISTFELSQTDSSMLLTDMTGKSDVSPECAAGKEPEPACNAASGKKDILLSVKDLKIKSYGTHIDLDVSRGEIIGVAGLQGHGQSDIVMSLFGLSDPVDIELEGRHVRIDNPKHSVKQGLAYVSGDRGRDGSFKSHDLSENIKVVQELVLKKKTNALEILKQLNVKYGTARQKITSLSGGNQQKVILGRWIHTNPLLLLANDPSKGIDVKARSELREILWALAEKGMSMVFVSSDEDELVSLCANKQNARVIVLYEGAIAATLKGSQVTRDNIIVASLGKGAHHS